MKSSKLLLLVSDLWNENQLSSVHKYLLRAFDEINKQWPIIEPLSGLTEWDCTSSSSVALDTCDVELLQSTSKEAVLSALAGSLLYPHTVVVYVGPLTIPFGQWILQNGLLFASDVAALLNGNNSVCQKLLLASNGNAIEDWIALEKKFGCLSVFPVGSADNPIDSSVETAVGSFVDRLCNMLVVTAYPWEPPCTVSFIKNSNPTLYVYLDKGSPVAPALLSLDGFSMLINGGCCRDAEYRKQLKYHASVDVGLVTHVGYTNIMGLSGIDDNATRINHFLLPTGAPIADKQVHHTSDPFCVDLREIFATLLGTLRQNGAQFSHVGIKGKGAGQLKPIQLFHKIGYGTLELIALGPSEDDNDLKKYWDEFGRGKYANDNNHNRPLPSSATVLLLWRPFSNSLPVRRLLYVGARSQPKKGLQTSVTTLYASHDCFKHMNGLVTTASADGQRKQTGTTSAGAAGRKQQTSSTTGTCKSLPKMNGTTSTEHDGPTKQRPSTAAGGGRSPGMKVTSEQQHAQSARPATTGTTAASSKPKPTQKVQPAQDNSSTATKKGTSAKSSTTTGKKVATTIGGKSSLVGNKTAVTTVSNKLSGDAVIVTSNDNNKSVTVVTNGGQHSPQPQEERTTTVEGIAPQPTDGSSGNGGSGLVAVGTVECAITEHGEGDFFDDTPEELSADQMRQMGLYDNEDNDDENRQQQQSSDGSGTGKQSALADLPMEGSFYGRDAFANADGTGRWGPPLALPGPQKDGGAKKVTATVRCGTPICVDVLCVPSDLDGDDLRCLFGCIRAGTVVLQLDRPGDLGRMVDLMLEERWTDCTVIGSVDDEKSIMWVMGNEDKLNGARIKVSPAIARRTTSFASGVSGDNDGDSVIECRCLKIDV